VYVLHLHDKSLKLNDLSTFPWHERSSIVIHLDPLYDSPDPDQPHMVDWNNREPYMKFLLNRAKDAAQILKPVLQESINAGTLDIQLVFGDC
jgi:hypothetical protein